MTFERVQGSSCSDASWQTVSCMSSCHTERSVASGAKLRSWYNRDGSEKFVEYLSVDRHHRELF